MRIQKIICDRCKKEIQEDPIKFCAEKVDVSDGDSLVENVCPDLLERDFCSECAKFISGWFKMQCSLPREEVLKADNEETQEKVPEAANETPGQKKNIWKGQV